ncbi:MAG: histidine--tRNA ligase [Candidatus Aenigmarchaeota archaeon]|nr:histidine--tRNA ligase [Candidatus Aenigmarchaeota archaeon]
MTFQKPKGTEDFLPKEMAERKAVFSILQGASKKFGFNEVDVPVVETQKLLTAKSGQEILQQLFTIEKKGEGEELALRFDLTVPMTRLFIEQQRTLPKPVKWFAIQKNWRYEAPQKGRLREFFQWSVELFGSDKPEADAEIINLALQGLFELGLKKEDFVVQLNNRKLLEGMLSNIIGKFSLEEITRVIDKSSKITLQEFKKELAGLGLDNDCADKIVKISQIKMPPAQAFAKVEQFNLTEQAKQGLQELKNICALLLGANVVINLSIARGLAYYTGMVFEIFDAKGKFRAIAGGGRYDLLVQIFGGEKTPAVGFGMGYATLRLLLDDRGVLPKTDSGPDFFVAPVSEKELTKALEIANQLRTKYTVSIDLLRRKISKQFDYANSIGAKKVIVIGENEVKKGSLKIKDMKTGQETELTVEQL